MFKVETFLGCAKLETGGAVIGWLCLIINCIGFLIPTLLIIVMSSFGCDELEKIYKETQHEMLPDFMKNCRSEQAVVIGVLFVFVLIFVGLIYISWLCIKGSKNRAHSQIKPMMIVMAITAVIAFLNIFAFTTQGVVSGLVYGLIYGYAFVVLYSLFSLFRDESECGFVSQYRAPTAEE